MYYPDCPEERTDCLFVHLGGGTSLMHSPLVYDREGNAVGGGMNITSSYVKCYKCNGIWCSSQTELERAQHKKPEWRPT